MSDYELVFLITILFIFAILVVLNGSSADHERRLTELERKQEGK